MTHTYALMAISRAAYDEIATAMRNAGYDHAFIDDAISMQGIAVVPLPAEPKPSIEALAARTPRETKMLAFLNAVFDPNVVTLTDDHVLMLAKREVNGYTIEDLAPIEVHEVSKFPLRIVEKSGCVHFDELVAQSGELPGMFSCRECAFEFVKPGREDPSAG